MPPSKRVRFDVFKRDEFTCQYCGRRTPDVILHVDHIIPRVDGGGDEIDNLTTSCEDCNLGKGPRGLDTPAGIQDIAAKADRLREREEQLRAYNEVQRERRVESILRRYLNECAAAAGACRDAPMAFGDLASEDAAEDAS